MNKPLSPAAQAVDDAARDTWFTRDSPGPIAAAALRAAADQVIRVQVYMTQEERFMRDYLLAIAAELEVPHG
jgi:hypothetical protein